MDERDTLSSVIAAIGTAGVDPSRWDAALGAIADLFGAEFATLETFDSATHRHIGFRASSLAVGERNAYLDHYANISPRTRYIWRTPERSIVYDHLVMDEAGMDRDPFYQEFLAPARLRYFMSGKVSRSRNQQTLLSLQRPRRRGHVSPRDIAKLQRLLPSLRNSADLSGRLAGIAGETLRGPLGWLSDAVAVLSPEETVIYANAAMEQILARNDGIALASRVLRFANPANADGYARALLAVKRNRFDPLAPLHTADLIVHRPSGDPPYVAAIRALPPMATETLFLAADPLAIVFIRDSGPLSATISPAIRQAFALTEAETRLAAALHGGMSPHDYADANGLSRNTVYTHLRRLKEKLGCASTTALVHLLGRLHLPIGIL